jgi:pyrroloquinoline-quinone synthase
MPTVQGTLDAIANMHKEMPFEKHPLWAGLYEGTFSKRQVGEFAKQFGIIPLHNHNYHGRLYVICPDPKWRSRIAEVVYEEGTGKIFSNGVPHNQLYLNFSRGLGIPDEEMWQPDYCAEALAFKSYFSDICSHNIIEGISAHMLASEAQGPGFFAPMARRMQKHYGLSDQAVDFWVIHDAADSDHSSVGAELLGDFAKTDQDRELVIKTARGMIEMTMVLYNGILNRVKAAGR